MNYAINILAAATLLVPFVSQANSDKHIEITFKDLKWEIPAGSKSIEFFDSGRGEVSVFYSNSSARYLTIHPKEIETLKLDSLVGTQSF